MTSDKKPTPPMADGNPPSSDLLAVAEQMIINLRHDYIFIADREEVDFRMEKIQLFVEAARQERVPGEPAKRTSLRVVEGVVNDTGRANWIMGSNSEDVVATIKPGTPVKVLIMPESSPPSIEEEP